MPLPVRGDSCRDVDATVMVDGWMFGWVRLVREETASMASGLFNEAEQCDQSIVQGERADYLKSRANLPND